VLVWNTRSGPLHERMRCATFAGETLATLVAHGVPLRTNHFMTCPVAEKFRPAEQGTLI
jgi:hypothetical protein